MTDPNARAAEVARASYGKLLAMLASRTGDIMAAEDALADAFQRALEVWPRDGVPDRPEAWLMTTAKHKLIDHQRRMVRMDVTDAVPEGKAPEFDAEAIPDERLRLLFVCAHPAIDPAIRTPLMLQTVLGLEAVEIGRAFLIPGPTMAQRLVRAKRKIRDARVPFTLPDLSETGGRMEAVLEAVYGAFATDWLDEAPPLAAEAVYLARVLTEVAPDAPEVLGLAALVHFIHARRGARMVNGILVPLHEQDVELWDEGATDAAEAWLARAAEAGQMGRFQLEAAIQSVHAARRHTGRTDWRALSQLYTGLNRLYPTVGGAVSHAAVVGEDAGAEAGLAMLASIAPDLIRTFQPAWAVRAHLLRSAGRAAEAVDAYDTAIKLCVQPSLRKWLAVERGKVPRT
ncbi:MAG: DUF6596 domain-containing protein [Pseudomonadota bacterium]